MPRQDTRLEAEGAEFLVLGQLLMEAIPAYKTYTNMPGYDLVATDPERNTSVRIQVKSRWETNADGFIIKDIECDFVVIVLLNRGSKDGRREIKPVEYFVLPAERVKQLPRTAGWGKVSFRDIPDLEEYRAAWGLVRERLQSAGVGV